MKLHPYTAVIRGLSRGASTGFIVAIFGSMSSGSLAAAGGTLLAVGAAVLLGMGYEFLYYQRYEYELTDDSLDIASGVVSRRMREIPLRRIQNVDVSQNAVHRLLGVATIRIETAGGSSTEAALQYLSRTRANDLQDALAEKSEHVTPAEGTGVEVGDEASGEVLFELNRRELVLTSVLSIDPGVGAIGSFVAISLEALLPTGRVIDVTRPGATIRGFGPVEILLGAAGVLAVAWLFSVVVVFNRYAGFRLRRVGEDLRYERGFLGHYSGTIPVGKVQTLSVSENPLKRRIGYATLSIETAGYAPGQSDGGAQTAVPLASHDRVFNLVETIEDVRIEPDEFHRPPARGRRRYLARYTLAIGAVAVATFLFNAATGAFERWYFLLLGLVAVPVAAHLTWRHRGYRETQEHFITRTGFWRRRTRVVPYYRIQTVVDRRTLFQRRRDLASVTADTASTSSLRGGDAVAIDVDETDADRLRSALTAALLARKDRRQPQEWNEGELESTDEVGPQS
ncbi:MAG: putative membrane protein [Halobacteriales archaeon]|jgi:putative membrane protein